MNTFALNITHIYFDNFFLGGEGGAHSDKTGQSLYVHLCNFFTTYVVKSTACVQVHSSQGIW